MDAPLGVLGPLARLHQPQEDPAALLLLGREAPQDLVGPVLQGTLDPAQGLERRAGQAAERRAGPTVPSV